MPSKNLYSRLTIRKIIKAHTNRRISKNADILVGVPYHDIKISWLTGSPDFSGLYAIHRRVLHIRQLPPLSVSWANIPLFPSKSLVREANIIARENEEKRLTPQAVREATEVGRSFSYHIRLCYCDPE